MAALEGFQGLVDDGPTGWPFECNDANSGSITEPKRGVPRGAQNRRGARGTSNRYFVTAFASMAKAFPSTGFPPSSPSESIRPNRQIFAKSHGRPGVARVWLETSLSSLGRYR
jgi:hypothetical protein